MKFFSLLSDKQVRIAPGQKVVPAQEYAVLQEASEILEEAKRDIEEHKRKAAEEAEQIKKEAFEQGFQEGLTSLNKHLLALDKELKEIREEVHKKILPLSLTAARKLISEELRLHPDRIVDIILTSLKPVTQHRKITIYANKADLDLLEKNRPRIKELFEHLDNLSIQERADVEPGGCIIETEAGIINAQLENQWRALELAFEAFAKQS